MECKVYTGHDLRIAPAVLIETLWNVKEDVRHRGENLHTGINRNIVECKDLNAERDRGSSTVLIETLWNVKNLRAPRKLTEEQSINRNIVECKAAKKRGEKIPEDCINRNIMECQRLSNNFLL